MAAAFAVVLAVPGIRDFFALDIPPLDVVLSAAGIIALAGALLETGRWAVTEWDRRERTAIVGRALNRTLDFLERRLRLEGALGLTLTVSLALLAGAGWALGAVIQDVVAGDDAARFDRPVLRFLVRHREPWLTSIAKVISTLGSGRVLIPLVVVVGLGWWAWRRTWRPLWLLAGAYLGADALYSIVKALTGRHRPPSALAVQHFGGLAFPSGHATQATAVWAMLAALLSGVVSRRAQKVAIWAGAVVVATLVGVSRLYLGAHWLTDVLGGWALGALWLATLLTTERTIAARRAEQVGTT
jgi:undecaprenyl-diphosphatase